MRVLIDATTMSASSAFRGIGTYLRNLTAALAETGEVELFALVTDDLTLGTNVTSVPVRRLSWARFPDLDPRFLLPGDIARAQQRFGVDVFHAPAAELPAHSPLPVVATLHDVVPLVLDGYAWERKRWLLQAPRFRAASQVVAVSDYSAREGVQHLGLDPERIVVAHHATTSDYSPDPRPDPGDFLLFVSEFDPRKRPELALQILDKVIASGVTARLLVTGRIDDYYLPAWRAMLASCANPERVEALGFVPQVELHRLLRSARVMVVTSAHEGFGLPALEAMASGTPVVAFANTATTEIIASGGALVADGDVTAFAAAVTALYEPSQWLRAHQRALARAAQFSWATSAHIHLSAYRAAKWT